MNREEFENWFKTTGTPVLNRFHQVVTDALSNRVVFWITVALAALGLVRLLQWII